MLVTRPGQSSVGPVGSMQGSNNESASCDLRSPVSRQFRHLAESTLEQTEIVSSMISLETTALDEILEEQPVEPEVVRLTQQGLTVDLTDDAGQPNRNQPDDHYVVAPGNTIYQRRGGGLRRRLEEDLADETE